MATTEELDQALVNSPPSRFGITEATLVALASGFAYGVAFLYEVGFFRAFGLPLYLVQTKLEHVLVVLLTLAAALWFLLLIANSIAMSWPANPALQAKVLRACLIMLPAVAGMLLYPPRSQEWISVAGLALVLVIFELALPAVAMREQGKLRERLIAYEMLDAPMQAGSLAGRLVRGIGRRRYVVLLVAYIVARIAYNAGMAEAARSRDFYVIADGPDIVVLRVYQDQLICARFDRKTRTVEPEVILRGVPNGGEVRLLRQRVGPLKVKSVQ